MATEPAFVISGLPLANPYVGQGVYTLRLIQGLARRGNICFLVILPPHIAVPAGLSRDNIAFLSKAVTVRHDLLNHIVWSNRLFRFVRSEFPEAVFHSPGPIASRRIPHRAVVTIHDCIYRSFPSYLGRFLIRRAYMRATERFAAKASLVLTDSVFSRDQLISKLRIEPDRIEVLYPWVGNEFLAPISHEDVAALRTRLKLPNRFWLYLGGYDYRKNIELLLEAYAKTANARSIPPLVLAGTVPSRRSRVTCDVLGTLKRLQLSDTQIRLPGLIDVDDLPALYKAASLLIYPSLMEGFGLPPAEAMAVGTPVLVSNSSSLPEVVQKPECLFDPTNKAELTDRLLAAAEDETQFSVTLPPAFTEPHGIKRYLSLMSKVGFQSSDRSLSVASVPAQ